MEFPITEDADEVEINQHQTDAMEVVVRLSNGSELAMWVQPSDHLFDQLLQEGLAEV